MNLEDAYQFLGLSPNSSESERFASYERMRGTLEAKLAKAPTPGLKEKYRTALTQLDEAIEAVENSVDGGDLPILQPNYSAPEAPAATPRGHAAPSHRAPSHQGAASSYKPPRTSQLVVVPKSILRKIICWPIAAFFAAIAGNMIYEKFTAQSSDGVIAIVLGSIFFLFLALMFVGGTLANKKSACPDCGHTFDDVTDEFTQCPDCLTYSRSDETSLTTVDENEVLEEPTFKAKWPAEYTWPNSCCVCRSAPTRMLEYNLDKSHTGRNVLLAAATGGALLRFGGGQTASIAAPYCDRCEDGIGLEIEDDDLLILFRSYGYYRDFCLINELSSFSSANRPA